MSEVVTWSAIAAENNLPSPNGFPENMAPSGVNNSARELMAAVRRAFDTVGLISSGALIDFDAVLADAISDVDATRLGGELPAFYRDFVNATGLIEYAQISTAAASILRNALLFAGQNQAFYLNASNIASGTLPFARTPFYAGKYSGGTSTLLPSGWTSAGLTVTHNLGTGNYVCVTSCSEPANLSPVINVNQGTNSMDFIVSDSSNHIGVSANFGFLVAML